MAHILIDARTLGEDELVDTNAFHVLRALATDEAKTHTYHVITPIAHVRAVKLICDDFDVIAFEPGKWFNGIRTFRLMKRIPHNLVHTLTETAFPFRTKPSVLSIHRISEFLTMDASPVKRMKLRIRKSFLTRSAQKATAVTLPSERAKRDASELFAINERNIHVIETLPKPEWYQAIGESDVERAKQTYNTGDGYFVGYCFDGGAANAVRFVRAFGKFARMKESTKLVLIGREGPVSHAVRDAIVAGELRSRVTIVGAVSEDDRIALSHGSRGIAYSNLYTENHLPVTEAATIGVPVMFSATGAMESLTENDGIAFHPIREESILEAFLALSEKSKKTSVEGSSPEYGTLRDELLRLYRKFLPLETGTSE